MHTPTDIYWVSTGTGVGGGGWDGSSSFPTITPPPLGSYPSSFLREVYD